MKTKMKRSICIFSMCLVLMLTTILPAFAADTNVNMVLGATTVNVGDTVTVEIKNAALKAEGFGIILDFDKTLLECTKITGAFASMGEQYASMMGMTIQGFFGPTQTPANVADTVADTNSDGKFSFGVVVGNDTNFYEGTVATLTFKAKASGTAHFTLTERTSGTDRFDGEAANATLTIKAAHVHIPGEPVRENINPATCWKDGSYDSVVYCADLSCGEELSRDVGVRISKTGEHTPGTPVQENYVGASCTAPGSYDSVVYCTVQECGAEISRDTLPIIATGHTPADAVEENYVGASCTAPGSYDSVVYCIVCGEELSRDTIPVDATGHTPADAVEENYVGASCTAPGSYDSVVYCSVCGEELSRDTVPVEQLEHSADVNYDGITKETHNVYYACCGTLKAENVPHEYDAETELCICGAEKPVVYAGWVEIEGDLYYYNPETNEPLSGVNRLPYPAGYEANAADKAYWEAHMDESKYTDAETAMFILDENGKLVKYTGKYIDGGEVRYAVDGMIPWHVGLVEIDGDYYYFKGDENGRGNIMATGKIYVSRNTTDLAVVIGGIYTFAEDGKLNKFDGIEEFEGASYLFDDYRMVPDAGLFEIDGDYYYAQTSNGKIVIGKSYWVAKTNELPFVRGMYEFDAEGKMVTGIVNGKYEGIVEIEGDLFYYIAGVKQVGAGIIEMTDDDGETYYIYVRSNGQLATGKYWPTTTNGYLDGALYDFGTDGRYYPGK